MREEAKWVAGGAPNESNLSIASFEHVKHDSR